jgi:hypothetical protein
VHGVIEYVYGLSVSGDFQRFGHRAIERWRIVRGCGTRILHGEYGNPYSWAEVYLQKDAEYRANRGPLFENLRLDSTCRTMNPMSTGDPLKVCLLVTLKYNAM